jgi:hypothetical protein
MKGPFSESPRPRAYLQGATAQRIVCADYRGLPGIGRARIASGDMTG